MKTFKLKKSLVRTNNKEKIPFEKIMFHNHWIVFDSQEMTKALTFHSDGTFEVTKTGKNNYEPREGQWKYKGGDAFDFLFDDGTYGLHLVHLDSYLMVFELHETKQYFILVSEREPKNMKLNSLDAIELYIRQLKTEVAERLRTPDFFYGRAFDIIPVVIMGSVFQSVPWFHDDKDDDNHKIDMNHKDDNLDEFDDEAEEDVWWDENDKSLETGEREEDESYLDDEVDEPVYDEQSVYEDQLYDDYGGLSDEEIIYDYLESQDEEY